MRCADHKLAQRKGLHQERRGQELESNDKYNENPVIKSHTLI